MNPLIKKIAKYFIAFVILVFLGIAYAYFFTFPYEIEARLLFMRKQDSLNKLADELEKHKSIRKFSSIGDSVWVEKFDNDIREEISGELAETYLRLMKDAGMPINWKVERGVLLYLVAPYKFDRAFNMAFIRKKVDVGKPECELSLLKEKYGNCEMILNGEWIIDYAWTPKLED